MLSVRPVRQGEQGGVHAGEEAARGAGPVSHEGERGRPPSHGLGDAEVLGAVLAPALHGELDVGAAQERIEAPRLQGQGGLVPVEAGRPIELERDPRLHRVGPGELLREAGGIPGGVEGLVGRDPRHLVLAVAARILAVEDRHHDLGTEAPNHPDHVAHDLLPGPVAERLPGALGIAEVEGPGEVLPSPVQAPGRQELAGAHDPQALVQLRPDQVLAALPPAEGEVGDLGAVAPGQRRDQARILVVGMGPHHQHPLDPVELAQPEARRHHAPVLRHLLGGEADGAGEARRLARQRHQRPARPHRQAKASGQNPRCEGASPTR